MRILRKKKIGFFKEGISFARVGKKGREHLIAHAVFKGKRKADKIANLEEVLRIVQLFE